MSTATITRRVSADRWIEIQEFYADQMTLLEERKLVVFLETLTEDIVIRHEPNGWEIVGREALLTEMSQRRGDAEEERIESISARDARAANVAYYNGLVYRYWFDKLRIEWAGEDVLRVRYQALVSMTDYVTGRVSFEPSTQVEDQLVVTADGYLTRHRTITHDSVAWADKIHNES